MSTDAENQGSLTSTRIVAAVEVTWSAIRRNHPDVPDVVTTLGAGTSGRSGSVTFGHFAAGRWDRSGDRMPELFVGGEGLARGARQTLGTLIHEASHGAAHTRGVVDTSRQGRWHNKKFKAIAEEFGLLIGRDPGLGWSVTEVPDATAAVYAQELGWLAAALTVWRQPWSGPARGSSNGVSAACGCGRRIRVAASTYAAGPILCGLCGQVFAA